MQVFVLFSSLDETRRVDGERKGRLKSRREEEWVCHSKRQVSHCHATQWQPVVSWAGDREKLCRRLEEVIAIFYPFNHERKECHPSSNQKRKMYSYSSHLFFVLFPNDWLDDFISIQHEETGEDDPLSHQDVISLSWIREETHLMNGHCGCSSKKTSIHYHYQYHHPYYWQKVTLMIISYTCGSSIIWRRREEFRWNDIRWK